MSVAVDRVIIRPARTADVRAIRDLVDIYSPDGRLLSKATVTLFEAVPEFLVAELDGQVIGCGALHVMWEDLAEVRTVAVVSAVLRVDEEEAFARVQTRPCSHRI